MALSKNALIAIIATVIIVIAGVGVIVATGALTPKENGVTYDGNGGVFNGKQSITLTNETVVKNMFTKEGYMFIKWNTKADGTGADYAVGANVASGTKLFATWSDKLLHVSGFSYSRPPHMDKDLMSFTINDRSLGPWAEFYPPAFIVAKGGENWFYDRDNSLFVGMVGGVTYTMNIIVTGCTDGSLVIDTVNGLPTVAFQATHDISVRIDIKVKH